MFESQLTLRTYQTRAIDRLYDSWSRGHRRPLLVAPTGSGKTVIAAHIIERAMSKSTSVWFIAPRRELIDQTCTKLDAVGLGGSYGVIMGSDKRRYSMAPVQVCSIDTLRARMGRPTLVANPRLMIIDEAHLYITEKRIEVLRQFIDCPAIGLTATPCRFDGAGLHHLFDDIVEAASVEELIEQGHLVPPRYFSLSEPDLARVGIRAGDYKLDELAGVMMRAKLVGDTVVEWKRRAVGRRTVVFAVTRAHSVFIRDAFRDAGVSAEHVDGEMPLAERSRIIQDYREGKFDVLCNCQLLQYGVDIPELSCVILARPTRSIALYLQMLGRGLRPAPGKEDLLVLDHSGAVMRHGFAEDDREWSLDGGAVADPAKREKAESAESGLITCSKCGCVFRRRPDCPSCGHFFVAKPKPVEALEGELVEVSAKAHRSQQQWFREALGWCDRHGKKQGAAYHAFRAKFKYDPPMSWYSCRRDPPSSDVESYMKSRMIAFAKSRKRAAA